MSVFQRVHMPSLGGATEWINSEPLDPAGLRGQVVLVNFWTWTCINWLRQEPYVRAWSQAYRDDGLTVIGVHTPEFSFEHDIDGVRRAVKERDIDYPVAVDNEYEVWSAFANNYWPALYFVDRDGIIRDQHFGEGRYEESERVIQELLGVERELVPPVRPEDEPGVILPAQTEDQPGAYSGPYEAGGVYAVLEGEGEVVVDGRAIAVSEPGCYELVTHPHHTQAVLDLRVGAGVTCHATCFTPAIPAAAPSGAARRPR
jgi:thiol-disulfide isomerase/thioredoxin